MIDYEDEEERKRDAQKLYDRLLYLKYHGADYIASLTEDRYRSQKDDCYYCVDSVRYTPQRFACPCTQKEMAWCMLMDEEDYTLATLEETDTDTYCRWIYGEGGLKNARL